MSNLSKIELSKKNAAYASISFLEDNSIIGIGSGTTVIYFIKALKELMEKGEKQKLKLVPSSLQVAYLLKESNLEITSLWNVSHIDLTIDGADEIDPNLNLLKGGGGAHTFEKILAYNSTRYIIIADFRKYVPSLCTNHPIPIEVLPKAINFVIDSLKSLGGTPKLRLASKKVGPVVTDSGNLIIDYLPIKSQLKDLYTLNQSLKMIPGVVETGLFLNMASKVILGYPNKVEILDKK